MQLDKLVSEKVAAEILGCSVWKLQRDRRIGSPIIFVKIGKSVKYRLSDLEAYIKKHSYVSTSQYEDANHAT